MTEFCLADAKLHYFFSAEKTILPVSIYSGCNRTSLTLFCVLSTSPESKVLLVSEDFNVDSVYHKLLTLDQIYRSYLKM